MNNPEVQGVRKGRSLKGVLRHFMPNPDKYLNILYGSDGVDPAPKDYPLNDTPGIDSPPEALATVTEPDKN